MGGTMYIHVHHTYMSHVWCEAKAQRRDKMAKVIRLRWLLHKRLSPWAEAARERVQAAAVQREAEKRREAERKAEEVGFSESSSRRTGRRSGSNMRKSGVGTRRRCFGRKRRRRSCGGNWKQSSKRRRGVDKRRQRLRRLGMCWESWAVLGQEGGGA